MIMGQTVTEFFKDREEYLKRPPISSIGKETDHRDCYLCSIGHPVCILNRDTGQYFFKDEKDDEYCIYKKDVSNEKELWKKFDKMVEDGADHVNVRAIIIQKKKDRKKRKERRERALKNPSGYFLKDKPEAVEQYENDLMELDYILYNFVSYWYGLTGCRGIINTEKVFEYISKFLEKNRKLSNLRNILKRFEKEIIKDGGVVKIS